MNNPAFYPIITLISGLAGAVIGYLSVTKAAKISMDEKLALSLFTSKAEAYQALLTAATNYEHEFENLDMLANFYSALYLAQLLSSEHTRESLLKFAERVKSLDFHSENSLKIRLEMLDAMYNDLLNIPLIQVKKRGIIQKALCFFSSHIV